jgi:hypothetical protein
MEFYQTVLGGDLDLQTSNEQDMAKPVGSGRDHQDAAVRAARERRLAHGQVRH